MAESIFGTDFLTEGYVLNNYNFHRFKKGKILVTTEHGAWALLDEREFELFQFHRVHEDPSLFSLLKEKGLIVTESNVGGIIEDQKKRFSFLFQGPSLHIVVPTMRCNQRCVYCHSRAEPEKGEKFDMDKKTAKKTLDFIFQTPSPVIVIEFQGGECLLNFEIVDYFISEAKKLAEKSGKKLGIALVSNLTQVNDKILKTLKGHGVRGLATSLDGPRKVHDKNRKYLGGKGSHADVVRGIEKVKGKWKEDFALNAMCTITRHSLDYGKEIVDEYIRLGFSGVWLRPLNNVGFAGEKWKEIGYSMDEFFDFYSDTLDYIIKRNQEGETINELNATLFTKKIIQKEDPLFSDMQAPCGAGIEQLVYDYKGDIFCCDEGKIFEEFKLGNVASSEYRDIFNETLTTMIDLSSKKNYLCDNCAWNPYCGICTVYAYASQGSMVSLLPLDDKCRFYSKVLPRIFEKILFSRDEREVLLDWVKRDKVFC